jgi:chromosomal replication initiator protein
MPDAIWLEARRRLRGELPDKDFDTWIGPLRAARWENEELTLEVPSVFFRDWVKRHFVPVLERAVSEASGTPATVGLVVNRALDAAPRQGPRRAESPRTAAATLAMPPAARYTFDNFVVGRSNQVAHGAALAVVAQPGSRFNPLFFYGGCGLGKTHLLNAVGNGIMAARAAARVACVSAENFVNAMIAGLKGNGMERFRQRFRGIETLVVDDVQFLAGKRRSQEEFCHTFNALHDGRKQIVLASDRAPDEMPGLEETLRNRFASGLLARIELPDPGLRRALVERKAAQIGLVLDADVVAYLAEEWCEDVRVLEGALTKLEAYVSLAARTITLGLVREALGRSPAQRGKRTGLARIIGEVCQEFALSRSEITSARRTAKVAVPRQLAMYLCRHHTDVPLAEIGAELGGRDHSTVVHALAAIERRLQKDATLRQALTAVRARLAG